MRILILLLLTFCAFAADKSDQAIETDIRARLARSKISSNNFEVRVQRGVATLTGRTEVAQHKGVATRMAKNAGATSVVNNIQVSERGREKASRSLPATRQKRTQSDPPASAAAAPAPAPVKQGDVPPPVRRATIKH